MSAVVREVVVVEYRVFVVERAQRDVLELLSDLHAEQSLCCRSEHIYVHFV